MRFALTGYQERASDEIVGRLRRATADFEEAGDYWSLCLTAPTGAGKTVVAAAVIERILYGDSNHEPDADACFLWVTDDPALNEQTASKLLTASSLLMDAQLETVGPGFDQEVFDAGRVYFLNIQKLARSTSYVQGGTDERKYSIWETIANTVKVRGGHFYLVVDEAHRGTRPDKQRRTIVSRIISDPDGSIPPAPIVFGISATPDRFQEAMSRASTPARTHRDVVVPVEEVRESGLLKDKVLIKHPVDTGPSDYTLMALAVETLRQFDEAWREYSENEGEPRVLPLLVVQCRPGVSEGELISVMDALEASWPELTDRAVGHAFETHRPMQIGSRSVRYIAPQDIQADAEARVILFKEALTTGWDCPRAEVMLSFRRAQDYTYIAQLVGRMVRAPLTKRIATNDFLNAVVLYLPEYEQATVTAVVEQLRQDPDALSLAFETNSVECTWNPAAGAAVRQLLASLPTYVVPEQNRASQVTRLRALATRLAGDGIEPRAPAIADETLLQVLEAERETLSQAGDFDTLVDSLGRVRLGTIALQMLLGDTAADEESQSLDRKDIDELLAEGDRRLTDGLASAYWADLVSKGEDVHEAKLVAAVLAGHPHVQGAVEAAAERLVQEWMSVHAPVIAQLPESRRTAYHLVRAQARTSELVQLALPSLITASKDHPAWPRHVYADNAGLYYAKLTGWEEDLLKAELDRGETVVAWYRNPPGGERAVRVPYQEGPLEKGFYPDLIIFERDGERVRPAIVDPHAYSLADAVPKWRGLAAYAQLHDAVFSRVEAVIRSPEGDLLRLDLKASNIGDALAQVSGPDTLLGLFRERGRKA